MIGLTTKDLIADPQGRLHLATDCSGHEFGISGEGISAEQSAILLPLTTHDHLRLMPGKPLTLADSHLESRRRASQKPACRVELRLSDSADSARLRRCSRIEAW